MGKSHRFKQYSEMTRQNPRLSKDLIEKAMADNPDLVSSNTCIGDNPQEMLRERGGILTARFTLPRWAKKHAITPYAGSTVEKGRQNRFYNSTLAFRAGWAARSPVLSQDAPVQGRYAKRHQLRGSDLLSVRAMDPCAKGQDGRCVSATTFASEPFGPCGMKGDVIALPAASNLRTGKEFISALRARWSNHKSLSGCRRSGTYAVRKARWGIP